MIPTLRNIIQLTLTPRAKIATHASQSIVYSCSRLSRTFSQILKNLLISYILRIFRWFFHSILEFTLCTIFIRRAAQLGVIFCAQKAFKRQKSQNVLIINLRYSFFYKICYYLSNFHWKKVFTAYKYSEHFSKMGRYQRL